MTCHNVVRPSCARKWSSLPVSPLVTGGRCLRVEWCQRECQYIQRRSILRAECSPSAPARPVFNDDRGWPLDPATPNAEAAPMGPRGRHVRLRRGGSVALRPPRPDQRRQTAAEQKYEGHNPSACRRCGDGAFSVVGDGRVSSGAGWRSPMACAGSARPCRGAGSNTRPEQLHRPAARAAGTGRWDTPAAASAAGRYRILAAGGAPAVLVTKCLQGDGVFGACRAARVDVHP
jgi:hypothetical protein